MMRVVQFSPPRTGSTLIWQTLKLLCDEVRKEHEWRPEFSELPVVATMRDPRDMVASLWRVEHNLAAEDVMAGMQMDRISIVDFIGYAERASTKYLPLWRDPGILWLRYERFWNDPQHRIDEIAKYLGITVPEEVSAFVGRETSIAQNMERAAAFDDYSNYDRATQVHGKHLAFAEPGGWKHCVPTHAQAFFSDRVLAAFEEWKL